MHLIHRPSEFAEAMHEARNMAGRHDSTGVVGYGVAHLVDGDGHTSLLVPFHNLITDAGDAYIATRVSGGTGTAPNGMKLGSATTAVAKNSTGSLIGTFITGSNLAFDATYPQTANLGANNGVNVVYKTTWAAGVATSATINEVAIVTDQATATAGSSAATYSRALLTTVNKGASDTLAITYNWLAKGA